MLTPEGLIQAARAAIAASGPKKLVAAALRRSGSLLCAGGRTYDLNDFTRVFLFGSGKASQEMADAVTHLLGDRIADGCIVSSYEDHRQGGKPRVLVGSHPVPTEKSIAAAEALMDGLAGLADDDFFIYVLSGGTSALVEKPRPPLTLQDLQQVTAALLRSGAPIEEINTVRKHLSQVKGGRLGRLTRARGIVLVMSDVIGDDLATIGSAPLFFDPSTFQDACAVLERRGAWQEIPPEVRRMLQQGIDGAIEETPKQKHPRIDHVLAGGNLVVLQALRGLLAAEGVPGHIMTSCLQGETREVARAIAAMGSEIARTGNPFPAPACLLFGGETTVTVTGGGRGGRNQEMALAALQEIGNNGSMIFLSLGTDGIDGPTDAAGAVADRRTWQAARARGLSIARHLADNDAYGFFEQAGGLVKTGPTGTNLMDITALLVQ